MKKLNWKMQKLNLKMQKLNLQSRNFSWKCKNSNYRRLTVDLGAKKPCTMEQNFGVGTLKMHPYLSMDCGLIAAAVAAAYFWRFGETNMSGSLACRTVPPPPPPTPPTPPLPDVPPTPPLPEDPAREGLGDWWAGGAEIENCVKFIRLIVVRF